MERVPGRIGVAGDWHGNTAWATRAVRKICALLPADGPRADSGNWAILDITSMRWLRFQRRPFGQALRGLVSR